MKLLRLKITDPNGFRGLHPNFELCFRSSWELQEEQDFSPFVCAGPNGSGKSNLLEVLAAIFFHVDCQYMNKLPDNFEYAPLTNENGFQSTESIPNSFELEYLISVNNKIGFNQENTHQYAHIIVSKNPDSPANVGVKNSEIIDETFDAENLPRFIIKSLLPEFVVGYSSGENEILSIPFLKMRFLNFDEYKYYVQNDDYYGMAPEGRLIFLDDHLNQIILLSNLLFENNEIITEFEKLTNIKEIEKFRILIGRKHTLAYSDEFLEALPLEQRQNISNPKLLSKAEEVIKKLVSCSTCSFDEIDEEGNDIQKILDFFVTPETIDAFKSNFDTSLEFFNALTLLYTLNYIQISDANRTRIYQSKNVYIKQDMTTISLNEDSVFRIKDFKLKKDNIEHGLYTRQLSDGEYQLLHSLGICLLFRNSNTLFLLDEPDTHFNPDWRSKFITQIINCFKLSDQDKTRDMLISTHAPFLISDSKPEKVLVFNKVNGAVNITKPEYNTLGASINKITMNTFNKRETIGGHAQAMLENLHQRFKNGENKEQLITEINKQLGDSVEKVLLIKTILDSMEAKG